MARATLAVAISASLAACSGSAGEPKVKPLPTPDLYPVLLTEGPLSPRIASYELRARLDPEKHRITGQEVLRWTNTGKRAVSTLPFHLYMNAFKNEESVFLRESHGRHRDAKLDPESWGWIEVSSIRTGGTELIDRATFPGPGSDETVLEVALAQPVAPGATIELALDFEVQLPKVFARTGFHDDFHMIGQWFPKIGVLAGPPGSETWHCEPFHVNSEFFADFGTYDVSLTVPDTYTVAATGILTAATQNSDRTRTLTYHAEDVHDFVWMADPYIEYIEADAQNDYGTVKVRVYHRPEQRAFAERHLSAGVGAIEQFSKLYVPYPWPIMSIIDPPVRAAMGAGGMEYPTLVTTAGDSVFIRPGMYLPESVTIHEVGHNWFQGILASNEVDEAWLDEGVNEYADTLVMDALYGEETTFMDWSGWRANALHFRRLVIEAFDRLPVPIRALSYEYPDSSSYGVVTYSKTAAALRTLENIVGVDAFRHAMKSYATRYAFRHPTGDDFFAALADDLDRDIRWFTGPAFEELGSIGYEVRDIDCRRKPEKPRGVFGRGDKRTTITPEDAPETDTRVCRVLIANVGRVPAPAEVLIEFSDGATERAEVPVSFIRSWHAITVEHDTPIAQVTIDPDGKLYLVQDLDRTEVRTESRSAAANRAAARIGFWTQTAMQVLGL